MKELKRVIFQYKIDGETYDVRKPSVREIKELSAKQKDSNGVEDVDESIKFLAKLGLPEEVANSLEAHMIEQVIEDISGAKKN